MKVKVFNILLCVSIVLMMNFCFAASYIQNGDERIPVVITYKDLQRLEKVATEIRGSKAKIINFTQSYIYDNTWFARLDFEDTDVPCDGDFVITLLPYSKDEKTQKITSLPFETIDQGTAIYGPCWYYFGLFDEKTFNICGFAICERIKRWPSWNDLSYNGVTKRGNRYYGDYTERSSDTFLNDHIK